MTKQTYREIILIFATAIITLLVTFVFDSVKDRLDEHEYKILAGEVVRQEYFISAVVTKMAETPATFQGEKGETGQIGPPGNQGRNIQVPRRIMTAHHELCKVDSPGFSGACLAAAFRYCTSDQGALSGFMTEHNADHVWVTCLSK